MFPKLKVEVDSSVRQNKSGSLNSQCSGSGFTVGRSLNEYHDVVNFKLKMYPSEEDFPENTHFLLGIA